MMTVVSQWTDGTMECSTLAPYTARDRDGTCKSSFTTAFPKGGVTGYKSVGSLFSKATVASLESAIDKTPVSVAIEAGHGQSVGGHSQCMQQYGVDSSDYSSDCSTYMTQYGDSNDSSDSAGDHGQCMQQDGGYSKCIGDYSVRTEPSPPVCDEPFHLKHYDCAGKASAGGQGQSTDDCLQYMERDWIQWAEGTEYRRRWSPLSWVLWLMAPEDSTTDDSDSTTAELEGLWIQWAEGTEYRRRWSPLSWVLWEECYAEKAEWCEDTSKDVMYEIKTGKSNVESLKATIAKEASNIDAQTAKIEELAGAISMDEADLKAATHIREKEEADFKAKEKDLVGTVDIFERAIPWEPWHCVGRHYDIRQGPQGRR